MDSIKVILILPLFLANFGVTFGRGEVSRTTISKTTVGNDGNDPSGIQFGGQNGGSPIRDSGARFPSRGSSRPIGGQGGHYPQYPGNNNINNNNNGDKNAVAFSVARASYYTRSAITTIKFDQKITDIGYGWNHGTGEFQCYYPGTYVFTWSAVSTENDKFRITLVKNSREEVAQTWGHYSGYQSASNSVVLTLQQQDRISLKITEGSIYEPNSSNRAYTTFTGYRLF